MKKLIITALCAAAAASGFAQGTVGFQNGGTSSVRLNFTPEGGATNAFVNVDTNNLGVMTTNNPRTTTGVVDVGLFWGTSSNNVTTLAGVLQISSTQAGLVNGSSVFAVSGTAANDVDFFDVIAWDASYGNNLAGMQACLLAGGWFGAASAGNLNTTYGVYGGSTGGLGIKSFTLGATAGPGTPIFGGTASFYNHINMLANPAPEPGTLVLGGLGAAALLLFRRRRS